MTVKPTNKGGRPRLELDEVERRALRLASDRARKAKTPEAKAEASKEAAALRDLAQIRATARRELSEDDPPLPSERTRRTLRHGSDGKLRKRFKARWAAITATGDYSRALDGTVDVPRTVLQGGWRASESEGRKGLAWLPPGIGFEPDGRPRSCQTAKMKMRRPKIMLRALELVRHRRWRKRQFSRLLKEGRGRHTRWHKWKFSLSKEEREQRDLSRWLDRWIRLRMRRSRSQCRALAHYDHRTASERIRARQARAKLSSDEVAALERTRAEIRASLPSPIDPAEAYRLLQLDDAASRPIPRSEIVEQWAMESAGLTITKRQDRQTDFELTRESFRPTGVDGENTLHIKARQAWAEFGKLWHERSEETATNESEGGNACKNEAEIAEAA